METEIKLPLTIGEAEDLQGRLMCECNSLKKFATDFGNTGTEEQKTERRRMFEVYTGIIQKLTMLLSREHPGLPDRDYCCCASFCDDPACNTHGPKTADGNLAFWRNR